MDPLTITGSCVGLLAGISALSKELANFVNQTREAHKDVDGFSRELASISLCVSSLKDKNFNFPPNLQRQLTLVLGNCERTMQDMNNIVRKHSNPGAGRRLKWSLNDGQNVARLRERLEAHKSTLDITLDLGQLTLVSDVREDTRAIRAELRKLRLQVRNLERSSVNERPMLQRFLEDSMTYAESVANLSDADDDDSTLQIAKPINSQSDRVSFMVPGAEVLPTQPSSTELTLRMKSSEGQQQNGRSKGKPLARPAITSDSDSFTAPKPLAAPRTQAATHLSRSGSQAKLRQTILANPGYQFEGRHCSIAAATDSVRNVYFSFSSVPIPIYVECLDLNLSGPEELAWVNETGRGVFYRWKNIKRFAYEEEGPQGYVQAFWVLHESLFTLHKNRRSVGIEIRHLKTNGTKILYEEDRGNEMHCELFAILEEAKQDAAELAPIITNLESYKQNLRMLQQNRSQRTLNNLVPGTFSALVEREREALSNEGGRRPKTRH
jgi:hypothetical protein